ncbi:hypothetical protein A4A49_64355, partial [Nicotiana attenuata]
LELDSKQLFVSRDVVFKESEFPFAANFDTDHSWIPDMPDLKIEDQELQKTHTNTDTPDTTDNFESEELVIEGVEQEQLILEIPIHKNTTQEADATTPPAHVRRSTR